MYSIYISTFKPVTMFAIYVFKFFPHEFKNQTCGFRQNVTCPSFISGVFDPRSSDSSSFSESH